MRHLLSQHPDPGIARRINRIRLDLLRHVQIHLHNRMPATRPLQLCDALHNAADALDGWHHGERIRAEAFNLRAYIAQELADGHSGPRQRNVFSYLDYAGLLDQIHLHNRTYTANLARQAWVDRMISQLEEALK